MWPSYLVEDHGGHGPVYARLEVLPSSRSWLLLIKSRVPISDVAAEGCNLPHSFSHTLLDPLRYLWVGCGRSLVPGPRLGREVGGLEVTDASPCF